MVPIILIIIIIELMNKKGKRPGSKPQKKKEEGEMRYSCTCGKRYLSQPAVYTHIKNKHNNDKINFRIIDSTKGQIENNRAFRLEYIQFDRKESTLMTLADATFVKIATYLKENKLKIERYLHDDDFLSDSQEEPSIRSAAQREVNAFVRKYGLGDFFQELYTKFERQLETFKIHSYRLNIRTEISKFFKEQVGWKVEAQVLFHFAKLIDPNQAKLQACQMDLWMPSEKKLEEFIEEYCKQWRQIR